MHPAAPASEYWPAVHGLHVLVVEPVALEYCPAAHSVQLAEPVVAANCPTAHGAHRPLPADEYCPVLHGMQLSVDDATAGEYLPSEHSVQLPPADTEN